jgi:hypothetical protein
LTVAGGTLATAALTTTTVTAIGAVTVGVNDTGHDVKFFGATSGKSWLWDESADTEILTGNSTISGTLGVTGLVTATAGISSGSNIVSDTDSTDDLGTTGVRWANLYVDAIVATDTIAATSYTGALLTAVTAVTQSAGNNSTKVATTAYVDAADVSLSGSTNNTIATVTGANALVGEANLTFDGSTLAVTGAATVSTTAAIAGKVVMGKTGSDTQDLVIEQSIDNTSGGLRIYETGGSSFAHLYSSGGVAYLQSNGGNIGIDASGNLGINQGSPSTYVNGNAAMVIGGTSNAVSEIAIATSTSGVGELNFTDTANTTNQAWVKYNHSVGAMELGSNGGPHLTLAAAAKTGINISSPDGTLHVHTASAGTVAATAGMGLVVENSTSGGMQFLVPDASAANIYFGSPSDVDWCRIYGEYASGSPYLATAVGGSERMRIDSSGNVNIGTAHTGAAKFEVNNNANGGFISGKATHGGVTGNSLQMWFASSSEADGDVPFQLNAAYGSGGTQVGAIDCTVDDITGGTIDSHWNHRSYQNSVAKVASLSAAGVWTDASAAAGKEYEGTRQQVWPTGILPSICALNVSKYRPANQPEGKPVREYHISPTAEDLFDAFGVGEDPHTPKLNKDGENITTPGIAPKDLAGIALVGIQELCELVEAQAARIAALESV